MIMADVLLWALVLLASYIIIVCYWLLASSLLTQQVSRCRERYVTRPVRSFFAGLLTFVPILFLAGAIGKVPHPVIRVSALVIGLTCILIALFGSAGLAQRVGEGLPSSRDNREPWRRTWRGGLVLGITFFLPFIGWFVVLPVTLISGFGSFVLALPWWERRALKTAGVVEPPTLPKIEPQP
jgi:hypothetical protein